MSAEILQNLNSTLFKSSLKPAPPLPANTNTQPAGAGWSCSRTCHGQITVRSLLVIDPIRTYACPCLKQDDLLACFICIFHRYFIWALKMLQSLGKSQLRTNIWCRMIELDQP